MSVYRQFMSKARIWVCEQSLVGEHHGIKLADANSNDRDNLIFVEKTTQALDLIHSLDLRRFARVQQHIDYILNTELYSGGSYCPGNVCQLDFGRWDFAQHPDWYLYMYAAAIVHEATHGHLRARGIRRTRRNKMQIERICRLEENRFLSRIESLWGDQLRKRLGVWIRIRPRSRNIQTHQRREEESPTTKSTLSRIRAKRVSGKGDLKRSRTKTLDRMPLRHTFFLKTAIPSRKATRDYNKEKGTAS